MDSLIHSFSWLTRSPRVSCCYGPALVAGTTLPRLRGCTASQTLIIHQAVVGSTPFVASSPVCVSVLQVPLPGAMPCRKGSAPPLPAGEGTAGEAPLQNPDAHPGV